MYEVRELLLLKEIRILYDFWQDRESMYGFLYTLRRPFIATFQLGNTNGQLEKTNRATRVDPGPMHKEIMLTLQLSKPALRRQYATGEKVRGLISEEHRPQAIALLNHISSAMHVRRFSSADLPHCYILTAPSFPGFLESTGEVVRPDTTIRLRNSQPKRWTIGISEGGYMATPHTLPKASNGSPRQTPQDQRSHAVWVTCSLNLWNVS